jgi:hypothetical protein
METWDKRDDGHATFPIEAQRDSMSLLAGP